MIAWLNIKQKYQSSFTKWYVIIFIIPSMSGHTYLLITTAISLMKITFFSIRLMAQLMEDNSAVDPTYVEDFLLTYRTFLESPTIMVRILCFGFFSQSSQIFSHKRNWCKNYNNQKLSNLQNFNPWTNWQKHQFCQITKCQIATIFV